MNQHILAFTVLLILLDMLLLIESMLPEQTIIGVHLVFTFTVEIFKAVGTGLSLLYFKIRNVDLKVCFQAK